MNQLTDIPMIVRALEMVLEPGQVTELRALEVTDGRFTHTLSGYFNDNEALAVAAAKIGHAKGIYFIPNVVDPALLARAENRVRVMSKNDPSTSDTDIQRRRWLLVDCDSIRPAGISATNEQHDASVRKAREIDTALAVAGWPDPILADSGNGAHLMYRVDLPAIDGGLHERALKALEFKHGDAVVGVDLKVFNPARIWKLYGTWARKGDSTADRPHRMARLLEVPDTLATVPMALLEELAASVPAEPTPEPVRHAHMPYNGKPFDLEGWMREHCQDAEGPMNWNKGRKWIFQTCPWDSNHTNGAAFVIQYAGGMIGAGCHHNGCVGKGWKELRELRDPQSRRPMPHRPTTVAVASDMPPEAEEVAPRPQPAASFAQPDGNAAGELREWMEGIISGEIYNVKWPWLMLTRLTQALLPGSIVMVCGEPGVGKTFFTLQCLRQWIGDNIRAAVFFVEKDRRFHVQRILAQLEGNVKFTDYEWVNAHGEAVQVAMEAHADYLNILGEHIHSAPQERVTLHTILKWIIDQCSAGARVLMVDPITAVSAGESRWIADENFVLSAQAVLKKYGASLVAITHPKQAWKGKASADNQAGGAAFYRFSDTDIWISKLSPPENVNVSTDFGPDNTTVSYKFRLHKTRDSYGAGMDVGYVMGPDLQFKEKGVINSGT